MKGKVFVTLNYEEMNEDQLDQESKMLKKLIQTLEAKL